MQRGEPRSPFLTQNRQTETRLDGEVERGHFLECGMQKRIPTGLKCYYKRKSRFVVARFLQHGINVQTMRGQDCGELCHNSRPIPHQKTQVPRSLEVAAHFRGR